MNSIKTTLLDEIRILETVITLMNTLESLADAQRKIINERIITLEKVAKSIRDA